MDEDYNFLTDFYDGVGSPASPLPSPGFDNVGFEKFYDDYISLWQKSKDESISAKERDRATLELSQLKEQILSNDGGQDLLNVMDNSLRDSFLNSVNDNARQKALLEDQRISFENKQVENAFKANAFANIGLNVAKIGVGVAQIIGGIKQGKNLTRPKYPEILQKNPQLSNRLSEALTESKQIDPRIKTQREADVTQGIGAANSAARIASGGNTASYAGQAQANELRGADILRQGQVDDVANLDRKKLIADRLIGDSLREDQFIFNSEVDKFLGDTLPDFQYRRGAADNLQQAGWSNLFLGLNEVPNNLLGAKMAFRSQPPQFRIPQQQVTVPSQNIVAPELATPGIIPDDIYAQEGFYEDIYKNPSNPLLVNYR